MAKTMLLENLDQLILQCERPKNRSSHVPLTLLTVGGLVVGLTSYYYRGSIFNQSQCEVASEDTLQNIKSENSERFQAWLRNQGADIKFVKLQDSQVGNSAGHGLFYSPPAPAASANSSTTSSRWAGWALTGWRRPKGPPELLATFQLSGAITARSVMQDPLLGPPLQALVSSNLGDGRVAVMLYLLVERLRGPASRLAPWIDMLPTSAETPLTWDESRMCELRGTTLAMAVRTVRRKLEIQWGSVQEYVTTACRELNVMRPPSVHDFIWAHTIFWSRGQGIPLRGHDAIDRTPHEGHLVDAIIPGMDMANHSFSPNCWWDIVRCEADGGPERWCVELRRRRDVSLAEGAELTICYGDKSNEELLLLYGFALRNNPYDFVMVPLPLPPPPQWDESLHARMELLQAEKLAPRLFLHATTAKSATAIRSSQPKFAPASSPRLSASQSLLQPDTESPAIPPDALRILESLVLQPQEVQLALELHHQQQQLRQLQQQQLQQQQSNNSSSGAEVSSTGNGSEASTSKMPGQQQQPQQHSDSTGLSSTGRASEVSAANKAQQHSTELEGFVSRWLAETYTMPSTGSIDVMQEERAWHVWRAGLRQAALSTLVRLLEAKVLELEGPEGTGSLEADDALLRTHDNATVRSESAAAPAPAGSHSPTHPGSPTASNTATTSKPSQHSPPHASPTETSAKNSTLGGVAESAQNSAVASNQGQLTMVKEQHIVGRMADWKLAAVTYRASQKRLARSYLAAVRAELSQAIAAVTKLGEKG